MSIFQRTRYRRVPRNSWFDPLGGRMKGARLHSKLRQRFGGGGLFLTLTYDQGEFNDPAECYRASQEQRHMRRFMHRLAKYLGVSLKGRWFRKLEWHRSGFHHYHVLLDWRRKIPHADLERLWGHGYVWVGKINANRIRYCSKYIAKEMRDLPAYVLALPVRSVKIVAVSPGLWGESSQARASSPSPKRQKLAGAYVTIGDMLCSDLSRVEVEVMTASCGPASGSEWCDVSYRKYDVSGDQMLRLIHAHGGTIHRLDEGGWVDFGVPHLEHLESDLTVFSGLGESPSFRGEAGEESESPPEPRSGGRALLLSSTNPDAPRLVVAPWVLRYLEGIGALEHGTKAA